MLQQYNDGKGLNVKIKTMEFSEDISEEETSTKVEEAVPVDSTPKFKTYKINTLPPKDNGSSV